MSMTAPIIMKIIINASPTAEHIIPAIAMPFAVPFLICKMPITIETTASGTLGKQQQQVTNDKIPQIKEAMPKPWLSSLLFGSYWL